MEDQNFRQMVRELRQQVLKRPDVLNIKWTDGQFHEKEIILPMSQKQVVCEGRYSAYVEESVGGSDEYGNPEILTESTTGWLTISSLEVWDLEGSEIFDLTKDQFNQIESAIENGYN